MSRKPAANHFPYFTLASTAVRSFWSGSSRFFLLTQGSTTWTVGSVKGFFYYIFCTLDLLDNKRTRNVTGTVVPAVPVDTTRGSM